MIAVDDELNARKLLQFQLDWCAIEIEFIGEASNGNEALDLIETLKPNIVFTDIYMPYMDGLELALKEVIEKETAHWNEYRKIKRGLLENTFETKEKYLLDLLVGTSSLAQLNKRYEYFGSTPK